MTSLFETIPILQQFPWLRELMQRLPHRVLRKIAPGMGRLFNARQRIDQRVSHIFEEKKDSVPEQTTIFHTLLQSDLPEHQKSLTRISDEAFVLTIAGTESTANVLTILTYHLLKNPEILSELRKELDAAIPDPKVISKWQDLEKLEYLNAVVKEALRISAIVTIRIAQTAPDESLTFRGWTIAPGTPIAMNVHSILRDPSVFDNPEQFNPERWLRPTDSEQRLERFLVPFSRGSRACLGLNLAYAELYLTTAAIFRRFDLKLVSDTEQKRDVDVVRDCFVGLPSKESKGVRVHVIKEH